MTPVTAGADLVRRQALALYGTTMRVLKGQAHFMARGTTFAFLREGALVAKLAPEDSRRLLEEGKVTLFEGLRSSRYGDWVQVNLETAPPDLVAALIDLAYRWIMAPAGGSTAATALQAAAGARG